MAASTLCGCSGRLRSVTPVAFRTGPVFEAENHRMQDLLIPPPAQEGTPRSKYSAF